MPGYIFTAILNVSVTASIAAAFIIILRLMIGKRLPAFFRSKISFTRGQQTT